MADLANERISIRTTAHAKAVIEQASAIAGISVSSFMVQQAYDKAVATIKDHQIIELNAQEWERMQNLLDNPPPPNEKMTALLARGKKLVNQ